MKRRVALVSAIVLTLVSSIPTYAGTDFLVPEDNSEDIVVSQKVYGDVITEELAALEDKYDMTKNMPEEVLAELSEVAEVSKEVEQLDDEYMQVSYNIFSEEPIMERTYNSGNTEELYNVTNYTYVVPLANSSGSTTDQSKQSDITIKNVDYYSYYDNSGIKMLKVTKGTTAITRFVKSNLRNLVLNVLSQGGSSGGAKNESNSKTIASPQLNRNYGLTTGIQYFYATNAAKILYGSSVTYTSGGKSYTARAQISLGN